jgi:hypothetical protein
MYIGEEKRGKMRLKGREKRLTEMYNRFVSLWTWTHVIFAFASNCVKHRDLRPEKDFIGPLK